MSRPYSDLYGGRVLNATISLFTHCHIDRLSGGQSEFCAADFDQETAVPLAAHDSIVEPLKLHRAVYARIVRDYVGRAVAPPIRVTTYSDAPPGSGVGSSSALVVAMVQAYVELFQLALGDYDIARLAYDIERNDCQMAGGKQDQYAAAFGGFNFMEFDAEDRVVVNPLRLKLRVDGRARVAAAARTTPAVSRDSARIIESQIAATRQDGGDAVQAMHELRQAADEMKEALLRGRHSHRARGAGPLLGRQEAHRLSDLQRAHRSHRRSRAWQAGATGLQDLGCRRRRLHDDRSSSRHAAST